MATLLHAHVRNDDGAPTSDPSRFALLMDGVRKHCPGMIIQLSTDGRSGAGCERGGMLPLRQIRVYENAPDLVEWLSSEMMTYGVKPEI